MKRWRLLEKRKRQERCYRDMYLDLALKHIKLMDKHVNFKNDYIILQKEHERITSKL
jgi:hypothetical protein